MQGRPTFATIFPVIKFKAKEFSIATKSVRINQEIRANQLRVIDEDGQQLGIMPKRDALSRAEQAGLDLVEISPNATPPVAKIIDWGKYQYQKVKEQQRNRRSAHSSEIKQMRLGLKIGQHDLDIKLKKIRQFLADGDRVKIMLVFRGREMAHQDVGRALMDRIIENLSEVANVEQQPQMAGRNLSIVVRSNPNAKAQNP